MNIVIDANILGEVCRGNKDAKKLLEIAKEHNLRICGEIIKEYKRLLTCKIPRVENSCEPSQFLKEWFMLSSNKWKKIQINSQIPTCIERLVKSKDFGEKDVVYVQVALKSNSMLVAQEHHFKNAKGCLGNLDINLLDISESLAELSNTT